MLALAGDALPRVEAIAFDRRVLAFTIALACLTPLVFGVVPALRAALRSTFEALKEGGRGSSAGQGRQRMLGALVVAQFALALMLSVGAGLLVRSFMRLLGTSPGFRAEQLVTASVQLPRGRYTDGPQIKAFYQQAVDAVRAIPGVTRRREQHRSTAEDSGAANVHARTRRRRRMPQLGRVVAATWTAGSYFEALGITLKRGRFFTDADGRDSGRVVILSEMLARRLWPDQDPIGHQIKWGIEQSRNPWMTVVGVVGDMNQSALGIDPIAQTYEPIWQQPDARPILDFYRRVNLLVRSDRDPSAVLASIRAVLARLDPELPLSDAQPAVDVVADSVSPQRFSMTVVGLFAMVALALAAIGIYGVLANAVSAADPRDRRPHGAGARGASVMWSVLRRALLLMAIGVAIGTVGALALTRVMAGLTLRSASD